MSDSKIFLSDVIVRNPWVASFTDLLAVVGKQGKLGVIMLEIDLKPEFPDTPRNWETLIESAFTWGEK